MLACKKEHLLVAPSYRKTPVLKSLFNFEYYEIFKSTYYFEEHLRTASSENVFMKKLKYIRSFTFYIKKQVFSTSVSETSENVCFYFMVGFP